MPDNDLFQGLVTELRRGTLTLAVLGCLNQPRYGYSLLQSLEGKHVRIEANTLYPMLRRLEMQGLLKSDWDTAESRPRKYYVLSDQGRDLYARLKEEWRRIAREIEQLLEEESS